MRVVVGVAWSVLVVFTSACENTRDHCIDGAVCDEVITHYALPENYRDRWSAEFDLDGRRVSLVDITYNSIGAGDGAESICAIYDDDGILVFSENLWSIPHGIRVGVGCGDVPLSECVFPGFSHSVVDTPEFLAFAEDPSSVPRGDRTLCGWQALRALRNGLIPVSDAP